MKQAVNLRGVVSHNLKMHNLEEDAKGMASDTSASKRTAEHSHLKPTDIEKVSDS